jgi:hypothetical protein
MEPKAKPYLILKDPLGLAQRIFYLRRIAFFLLLSFSVTYSSAQNAEVKIDNPKQSFEKVKQGEVVKLKYVVTNTGTVPLILKDYEVECSCTSADYATEPVLPGKSVTVLVTFDTKSAYERQDRSVDVFSNVKGGSFRLRFKGYVIKKK